MRAAKRRMDEKRGCKVLMLKHITSIARNKLRPERVIWATCCWVGRI